MSKVRCNNCMKEFDEEEIVFDDGLNAEYCPYCGESGCLMDLEDKTEGERNDMGIELKGYKKYQLEWMIEHGYSLEDLMDKIAEIMNEELTIDVNAHIFINEAFDILANETGFKESEIWACEDEWVDNEFEEDDDKTLYELASDELNENPYDNSIHKDLIKMFVSEHDDVLDRVVFYVEKEWLINYVNKNFDVYDFNEWLEGEYTSEESEPILFDGIRAGVIAGVYKA